MTRPRPTADRGTYIGLLQGSDAHVGTWRPRGDLLATCCADRPDTARAYTCGCGQLWRVTQDGWIKIGTADADRLSPREA